MDSGRRMFAEQCGGHTCVPLVKSTNSKKHEPTINYDLKRCGAMSNRGNPIVHKALQLKVSTHVKNTLRPAEYPWLVSFLFEIINYFF